MTSFTSLTQTIENLWYMAYGLVAGLGVSVIVLVLALIILLIRTINLQRRVDRLENRIITNEREFNLFSKTWPGKK
jgi:maltodextrin utilization protein YvdJ